jgi:hypothetical protein
MDLIANLLLSPAAANLAQVITALVAAFALVYARAQILSARATQRESTAKELYGHYLILALANPSLANPDLSAFDFVTLTVNGSRERFEQYAWVDLRLRCARSWVMNSSTSARKALQLEKRRQEWRQRTVAVTTSSNPPDAI